jgi:hypothetical protein
MLVLSGVFKDNIFVPDQAVSVLDGTRAVVSIEETAPEAEPNANSETVQQKSAWHTFFEGIRHLNEELPAEFDAIIEKGIVFNRVDFS